MAYWAVELIGHEADLAEVERALNPRFNPKIEQVNGKLCLLSGEFEGLVKAEDVRERAHALIGVLNGAVLLLRGAQPVRGGCIFRVQDDGRIDQFIIAEAMLTCRPVFMTATLVVTDQEGNVVPPLPPAPSDAQKWMDAATADDDIADLLTFLGRADNWFDLYKAIEMAERIAGGERKLPPLLGSSATDFKNARRTANCHRHIQSRAPPPARPATLEEARVQVQYAVRMVLEDWMKRRST
ncbi:MAG: hypothetical protein AB7O98_12395 [Hyphomonadaceae bacterium]